MDGRNIPGFYYDQERKKYFRILPNHHAPPSGSKYAKENIKKRAEESKKRKLSEAFANQKRQQQVQQSIVLQSPIARSLERELGRRGHPSQRKHDWAKASAHGLQSRAVTDENDDDSEILHFDVDPVTRSLVVGRTNDRIESIFPKYNKYLDLTSSDVLGSNDLETTQRSTSSVNNPPSYYCHTKRIYPLNSRISSMNISPASGTLVTTTMGSSRPPIIHLTTHTDLTGVSELYTPHDITTIWTSAPSPSAAPSETIAVGTSNALLTLTRTSSAGWTTAKPLALPSDALALTWLSPTTLALGLRNASIHLWDARSRGHRLCLVNRSAVTALRRADDATRLVVAGLRSELALLDLRMPRAEEPTARGPNPPSLPVLAFDYANEANAALGLDVQPELGLVAAGDENGAVRVYSLRTGETLREFVAEGGRDGEGYRSHCVRFVEDERGEMMIMAALGKTVMEFAW